jgi:glycosidase
MDEYPHFNIVGEESNRQPAIVAYWQRGKRNRDAYVSYLPSALDFPLQDALVQALVEDEIADRAGLIKLSRVLANDFEYADPNALVIFADNHDMSRIFTQLNEDYGLFKMAMVYILTMRGTPQIFYGTEILMHNRGTGEHGIIRSDFPGGWPGDQKNAFTGDGLSNSEKQAQDFVRHLLNWRKTQPVIHHGKLMQFVPHNAVYAYVRYDDNDKVLVVFNKNKQPVALDKVRYAEQLAGHSRAIDVLTGDRFDLSAAIEIPARGVLLLELK